MEITEKPIGARLLFNRKPIRSCDRTIPQEGVVPNHFSSTRDQVGANEVNKYFPNDLPTRADTQNFDQQFSNREKVILPFE